MERESLQTARYAENLNSQYGINWIFFVFENSIVTVSPHGNELALVILTSLLLLSISAYAWVRWRLPLPIGTEVDFAPTILISF